MDGWTFPCICSAGGLLGCPQVDLSTRTPEPCRRLRELLAVSSHPCLLTEIRHHTPRASSSAPGSC